MQTRQFPHLPRLAFAVLCTILVGGVGADGSTFEGTWLNEVNIVTCPPAPHEVLAIFQRMTTYRRGGILIEGGGPVAPLLAVSGGAGHGIWERTGSHTFRVFFRSHSFDNPGRLVRITEVTTQPHLIKGDNPETPDVLEPYYRSRHETNTITHLTLSMAP